MALYSLSQRQYLYNAINEENPDAITPMDFDNAIIGTPRSIATTATGANTEITVRGRQGRGYVGAQTFRYKRLSLNDMFRNITPVVNSPNAYGWLTAVSKKTAFVQNINGRYGLNLLPEDIPDQYISLNVNNTLRVLSNCVQYFGTITFMSVRGKNSLEDLVVNDLLPVLNHPVAPTLGKQCVTLLAYGVDFTDEPQVMGAFKDGRLDVGVNFTSGATENLMVLLTERGLPTFDPTGASIKRYKTTAYSQANTAYDNVLVITSMTDEHYAGDWLLHYNN